jgi:hypothetical protein
MKKPIAAAASVFIFSLAGRFSLPLYLEPWAVVRQVHLWQLLTWIPSGASLTFIAHAALLGFAIHRGAKIPLWLGATFAAGALTTLLAFMVPAVLSCTFTGAGVGATAALWSLSVGQRDRRRLFALAALAPALLDISVDGFYMLVPHAFAIPLASLGVRWSRRPVL